MVDAGALAPRSKCRHPTWRLRIALPPSRRLSRNCEPRLARLVFHKTQSRSCRRKTARVVGLMRSPASAALSTIIPAAARAWSRARPERGACRCSRIWKASATLRPRRRRSREARAIVVNAKCDVSPVCGATETPLIDDAIAAQLLLQSRVALREAGCQLRGDAAARASCPWTPRPKKTGALVSAPMLSIRVVAGIEQAMAHIARYGSQHTDAIVTEDAVAAARFLREVDSAIVSTTPDPICRWRRVWLRRRDRHRPAACAWAGWRNN